LREQGFYLIRTAETVADGRRYIAFVFDRHVHPVLLVYQVDDGDTALLLDTRSDDLPGLWSIEIVSFMDVEEWGDLNQDGIPDIVVYYSFGGNSAQGQQQVHLWQVDASGKMVDLTAPIYEYHRLTPQYTIEDMNDDGILEIYVVDNRGEWYGRGHTYILSFKIYAWQGDQVDDVSDEFKDRYDRRIAEVKKLIEGTYADWIDYDDAEIMLQEAFRLLLDYENSGRYDEGWQVYWELTNPENWCCLRSGLVEYLAGIRECHRAQYEAGERFGKCVWP
jgi:hypothetical protein